MATCRTIFNSVSTFLNCRTLLQTRNQLPCYQQCAFLTGKEFEKLGLKAPPKKPLVPFFMYKEEAIPKIKAENPQMTQRELFTVLGKEWETYDPEKKEILQKKSAVAFQEYKQLLADYKKSLTPQERIIIEKAEEKKKINKKLKIRRHRREELQKPKKPLSAYSLYFCERLHDNMESGTQKEKMKSLAIEWKSLPAEEQRKYHEQYAKNKAQYRKDLQIWEEKMIEQGNLDVLGQKALRKLHKKYKEKQAQEFESDY